MPGAPWTFDEARNACRDAARAQADAETALITATRAYAAAEEAYRVSLAREIVRQHDQERVAWTVAPDLARGNATVAELRRERDIAEGLREACQQAAWRHAANRRDAQRFADWSMRRNLAENGGEPQWSELMAGQPA